jgi:ribosomal protein L29
MNKSELKNLTYDELMARAAAWRKEFFDLKLSVSTGQVKDYSQFKKLQKNIARALTVAAQVRQER